MRCNKTFNNRLKNDFDNLGSLVTGATKDIKELAKTILVMQKYGQELHGVKIDAEFKNAKMKKMKQNVEKKTQDRGIVENIENEGILGKIPDNVESIAELMLFDSDVNVYQEKKVNIKQEAFNIRGVKKQTKVQRENVLQQRKARARAILSQKIKKEMEAFQDSGDISLLKKDENFLYNNNITNDGMIYRPNYKPAEQLAFGGNIAGIGGVADFDSYNLQGR